MKPKKIRTKIEETPKDKEDLLLKMAFSGQLRETTMVANTAIAGNLGKEIQKRLAMLPEYQATRCGVMSCATGEILPGVAVWGGTYTLKGAMARMRVRVLLVFRGDYCETWALPMEKVDNIKALPGSAFSGTEVAMLIAAANALAFLGDTTDHVLANGNPADKATLNTIKNEQPKVCVHFYRWYCRQVGNGKGSRVRELFDHGGGEWGTTEGQPDYSTFLCN